MCPLSFARKQISQTLADFLKGKVFLKTFPFILITSESALNNFEVGGLRRKTADSLIKVFAFAFSFLVV